MLNRKSQGREIADAILSPAGTKIIAQGKAAGRNPGYNGQHHTDPEGVEQTMRDVAPFQGAKWFDNKVLGLRSLRSLHPRLLSLSSSATGKEYFVVRENLRDAHFFDSADAGVDDGNAEQKSQGREIADAFLSPTGTKIIAQGKAAGRNPGYNGQHQTDPEGVEQTARDVVPLQGAKSYETKFLGLRSLRSLHPRLLSLSSSATGRRNLWDVWQISGTHN